MDDINSVEIVKSGIPFSLCHTCDYGRKCASPENTAKGWAGCFLSRNNGPRGRLAVLSGEGWITNARPWSESEGGALVNDQLCSCGVTRCGSYMLGSNQTQSMSHDTPEARKVITAQLRELNPEHFVPAPPEPERTFKVNLTYFKDGGKFYSEGSYVTSKSSMYEIWDEVETMETHPGLGSAWNGIVSIDVPQHPGNHPHLLVRGSNAGVEK